MVVIWILTVLLLLGILICWTRMGVHILLLGNTASVDVTVGPIRIHIYPGKEKNNDAQEPAADKQEGDSVHSRNKLSLRDIRDLFRTLWPPLKKAISGVRRGIRIAPLQLSVVLGGEEDPANAAQLYGSLHGAVWTVMPFLEQWIDIRDPHIHLEIDFEEPRTKVNGKIGGSIRIGTALRILLSLAIPGIRWFLRYQKQQPYQHKKTPVLAGSTEQ